MSHNFEERLPIQEFPLWEKIRTGQRPLLMTLEIISRCNFNCRHCYINMPVADSVAQAEELSFSRIQDLVDRAVDAGVMYCILTGGEPLLRADFTRLYRYLRRKGLGVTLFTNASLVTPAIVRMLRQIPPRVIEVTVYGVTSETYERVTRVPGSFAAFMRGLDLLQRSRIPVRLKAMIMRSNVAEFDEIMKFCQARSVDYVRFDPFLHLRYDGNAYRNDEIRAERLSPEEIVDIERRSPDRVRALNCNRDKMIMPERSPNEEGKLFYCGISTMSFTVSVDGYIQACLSLRDNSLREKITKGDICLLINTLVQRIRSLRTKNVELYQRCLFCRYVNLCMWCPGHAFLESGSLDGFVPYFCEVAHKRAQMVCQLTDSAVTSTARSHK